MEALGRVWSAARDALDEARIDTDAPSTRPQLLAPDGFYQHMPLRLIEVDQTDLDTLAAALDVCATAITHKARTAETNPWQRKRLDDLADVLDQMSHDPTLWPHGAAPTTQADRVRPLAALLEVAKLSNEDQDAAQLIARLSTTPDTDLVLTPTEEVAYQRLATRLNTALTGGDALGRWLY